MELFATVLREGLDERERVQLYIRIPVSEALQDGRDDVSCTRKDCRQLEWFGKGKVGVGPMDFDLPLLALFLYFIAQVKNELPVLASQSLIRRFR